MQPRQVAVPVLTLCLLMPLAMLAQAPNVTVQSTLDAAARYLSAFQQDVAGVVLEEEYVQQARSQVLLTRELRSDLSVMSDAEYGWIEFRDVFEVDGKAVRDRDDRVMKLFAEPAAGSLDQARRIVQEGARFNLTALGTQFDRTINLPMAALMFLRRENQSRSEFRRDGGDGIDGRRTVKLRFRETARPRMIRSADDAAAEGAFWIDPESGRVYRTELILQSRRGTTTVMATIRVNYAEQSKLGLWLPRDMEEGYTVTGGSAVPLAQISGRAAYSNARKFRVAVDEAPTAAPPP